MRVLLYIPSSEVDDARRLEKVIGQVVSVDSLESYAFLPSLALRLQDVLYEPRLCVLFAGDRNDLLQFEAVKDILSLAPIFLVIPDQQPETIAIAHQLRPRFLTSRDSDYADLSAVLKKKLSSGSNWPGRTA